MPDSSRKGFSTRIQLIGKLILDRLGGALLLLGSAPVVLFFSVLVRLHDGGPSLHRRRVIGPKGEFDAFKLRTMKLDADEILAQSPALRAEFEKSFKLKDDPRITRLGAWLRSSSLDELPQFLNVVMGQMSLVGPRMVTSTELAKYGNYKNLLLSVKPGLTGYWQVNGRQETTYEDRIRMDIYYIQNWTLWLDLRILLKTPGKVIRRKGAY